MVMKVVDDCDEILSPTISLKIHNQEIYKNILFISSMLICYNLTWRDNVSESHNRNLRGEACSQPAGDSLYLQ